LNWKEDLRQSICKVHDKIDNITSRTIVTETKVCNFVDREFPRHQEEEKEFQKKNNEWHEEAQKKLTECPKEEEINSHEIRIKEVECMSNKFSMLAYIITGLLIAGFGAVIAFLLKLLFRT
jgi:predicted metal-binding protein